MRPIPYGRQQIDEEDVDAVVEVLRGDWLTQGPKVAEFEAAVAARCGARHGVAVSSGTAALHLAMLALDVGPGDEIVAPAMTFLATANCGVYAGAEPRFADVDPRTTLMTEKTLAPALTRRTKAVLPVHFAGLPCDMPRISALVRERCPGAAIVEDASHALGATHDGGAPVGSLPHADLAVLSFHPVKHVAAGEGGMVLADRDDLAERLRRLRSHGTTKEGLDREGEGPWYYEMHEVGLNYRLTDLACALGLSQLGKLDRFLARRRELAATYHRELAGLPHVELPEPADVARSAWHLYVLRIDFASLGATRAEVVRALRDRGVLTQVHYYPVPLQPYYRKRFGHAEGDFPGAEEHYARALTIPLFPAMGDDDAAHVVCSVREVLGG